jgi:hypothetical protein
MCMRVCVHVCSNLVSVRASTWGLDDNDSSKRTTMHGLHDLCKVGSTITISCTSVVQSGALVYIFSCVGVDIPSCVYSGLTACLCVCCRGQVSASIIGDAAEATNATEGSYC